MKKLTKHVTETLQHIAADMQARRVLPTPIAQTRKVFKAHRDAAGVVIKKEGDK